MVPSVFLVLPLLLPVSEPTIERRERQADIFAVAPSAASESGAAPLLLRASVIPPLYARQDRGLLVSLSPGSPCTAACLRLQVTF